MAFTRNRPTASELLSFSQSLIRDNFNSSDDTFGVDHYQFSDTTANKGRHKIVEQTINSITPSNPAGQDRIRSGPSATTAFFPGNITQINQIFAANYTPDYTSAVPDTQLFALTGNNGLSQLTGNFATEEGWQWIGGTLLQWGFVSVTTSKANQTTIFKDRGTPAQGIPFPNNCFNVNATIVYNGAPTSTDRNFVLIEKNNGPSPSKTQFRWTTEIEDSVVRGFFWQAIGN